MPADRLFLRERGEPPDEPPQALGRLGRRDQAHGHGDGDRRQPSPDHPVKVLGHGRGPGRESDEPDRGRIEPDPGPQGNSGHGPGQEAPEAAGRRGPLPEHPEQDRSEERDDEEAEQGLDVIHDAGELHHRVSGPDADEDSQDRAPSSHPDVMGVLSPRLDIWTIEVIGPDRGERADISGHAGHEARDEGRDAQAQETGPGVAGQHQRQDLVIAVGPGGDGLGLADQQGKAGRREPEGPGG